MNQWDDQEWFNSIYHSTQKQLSLAMLRIVRNHPLLKDNVDELLADTYCEMHRNREKLRTHPNLCAWLITTLKYKAYDKLREKLQEYGNRDWLAEIDEYSTASNVLSPEDAYIRKETIREIRKMISNMTNMSQHVVVWEQDGVSINISGNIAEQDIHRMVESIE